MALKAGIALRTYKRIELSGKGTLDNLIAICRVMDRINMLGVLFPSPASQRISYGEIVTGMRLQAERRRVPRPAE
jgi:hypothetical protein